MQSVKPRINPKNRNVEPFDRMLRRFKKQCESVQVLFKKLEIDNTMRNLIKRNILKTKRLKEEEL